MKKIVLGCTAVLTLLLAFATNGKQFEEGKQYQLAPKGVSENELVQDLLKEDSGKVQIIEFFSYGCSWCYKLDPYIEKWAKTKPEYVAFQRIPVEFHSSWAPLTKAYYTQLDLKILPQIHTALFEAVNNGGLEKGSNDALRAFFEQRGVKGQDFTKVFTSFDVTRKQKWASAISKGYRITAIPAVVVQGPAGIYISTVRMAGGENELIAVINHLTELQHQAYKAALQTQKVK